MKSTEPLGRIETIGKAAHELFNSQLRGKILAVVSQAAYLLSDKGELFWLATGNVPLHRRCIQLSGPLPRLGVDSAFSVNDQHLILDPGISLDFSQAATWTPSHLTLNEALALTDIPRRLNMFISLLEELPLPAGYGNLIPEIMQLIPPIQTPRPSQNLSIPVGYARPIIEEIARACLVHDMRRVLGQAESLVGLGEGLTPSGDDFVGGLLFCCMILRNIYDGALELEFPDLSDYVENLKIRTNTISHTLLKDHADGHGMDVLHQFVTAFLTSHSLEDTRQYAVRLVLVGHSTGWDLLAGVLTGMLLTIRSDKTGIF